MGQYYKAVCLDKRQYLESWDTESGSKLMEHSWLKNLFVDKACMLLSPGNSWHKTKIVWAGDYGDEGLFIDDPDEVLIGQDGSNLAEKAIEVSLYCLATHNFKKPSMENTDGPDIVVIVNHTKNEYVNFNNIPIPEDGWIVHPLPILTSSGCFRGGGDYQDETNEYVGTWAGDVISSDYVIPEGMTEIFPNFIC
jgi:hypothetical protein